MDKDTLIKYAPVIIVVMGFFFSYNIFVTPQSLEIRLEEFNSKIEAKYATKTETSTHQKQLDDISKKIDKIYDYIIGGKK